MDPLLVYKKMEVGHSAEEKETLLFVVIIIKLITKIQQFQEVWQRHHGCRVAFTLPNVYVLKNILYFPVRLV